jgi:putative ABC transport system permease protein
MRHTLWHDLREGCRILGKNPGSAAISILLTIVLGLGMHAAFSFLMAMAHRHNLAVRGAGQLMVIAARDSDEPASLSFSFPLYLNLREKSRVITGVAAQCREELALGCAAGGERVRGVLVSGNYFEVLGARPVIGRLISDADDHESITSPVAVISYEFWKRRFGMDPSILNCTIILNGYRFKVIGVTGPGFTGTDRFNMPDVLVPLSIMRVFTPPVLRATRVDLMETARYE